MKKKVKEKIRDESLWTKIPILKKTRRKLNIKKEEMECKTIDELINKILKKKR